MSLFWTKNLAHIWYHIAWYLLYRSLSQVFGLTCIWQGSTSTIEYVIGMIGEGLEAFWDAFALRQGHNLGLLLHWVWIQWLTDDLLFDFQTFTSYQELQKLLQIYDTRVNLICAPLNPNPDLGPPPTTKRYSAAWELALSYKSIDRTRVARISNLAIVEELNWGMTMENVMQLACRCWLIEFKGPTPDDCSVW